LEVPVRTPPLPRLAAGLSAGALALALTACGSDSTSSSAPESGAGTSSSGASSASSDTAGSAVTATEADFSIALSEDTLPAGTYTFTVTNSGSATHSLEISGPGVDGVVSDKVQGGESTTMTVTLQPGTYDVWCPIGNHRAMGMDTTLTVT
jgi:plastocyanin